MSDAKKGQRQLVHENEALRRQVAALQAEVTRVRTTLQSIGDAVIATDATGQVLQMNRMSEKLTGWAEADARGKPLDEVFHIVNENTRAEVESPVNRVLREGMVVGLANHTLLITKDGSERAIADSGAPIRDEKGKVSGVVLVFRDQTEERAAQQALQKSEAFNRTIVESIPQGLFLKDRNNVYLAVNEPYATSLGYRPEQIVGKDDFAFYPTELAERYRADDRAVMESGRVKDIEEKYPAQGKEYWVHTLKAPVKGEAGQVTAVLGLFEDITERKRMEQSLKKAQDRLEEAQRAAHLGNWAWDAVKDEITGSEEFYRLFDVAPEVVVKFSQFVERLHPDDRERVQRDVADALKQDRPYDTDYRVRLSDGGWREIIARGRVFAASDGKAVRMVGTCLDVTERKRMEVALRESEQRLRRFYESGLLGVIFWNMRGQIIDANDRFLQMVGYTRDDLVAGQVDWVNMTPPEYRHLDEDSVAELKATGVNKVPFEKEYLRKDGTRMPIAVAGAMLDEERVNGVAFVLDLTERKRMEERISHLNLALKAIRNVNQLIVREKDAELLIRRACEVLTETRGYSSAWIALYDESGKYLRAAAAGLGNTFESLENCIRSGQLAACGKALHERGVHVVRNPAMECPNCPAATLNMHQSAIAVRLEHEGHVLGLLVMSTDPALVDLEEERHLIEEVADDIAYALHGLEVEKRRSAGEEELRKNRDELEQRVRDRTAQLEESNKEMEAFSYSVSHDLRAPLRAIDGFSHALMEDYGEVLTGQGKDYLARVRHGVQMMGNLIDDMLKLSRVTRGELVPEAIDLSELMRSQAKELVSRDPSREAEFVIAPEMKVEADRRLVQILVGNLLENAWKFTRKKPKARIECGQIYDNGTRAFFIRDNGVGFDMKYVEKLFSAFQRLHERSEYEGTGIGLVIVKRIANRHGGRAWAEAVPGEGSTFFFTLSRGEV